MALSESESSDRKPDKKYDAIVVGAGISGLIAATELNHRGLDVLVIEHNHQPGGLMAGIRRKGFYFDVGCQSFENMGIVFPLLKKYGLSHLFEFRRVRYRIKMPDFDTIVTTLKQTRNDFKKAYPELADGFDSVFDTHEKLSSFLKSTFQPDAIPYVFNDGFSSLKEWLVPLAKNARFLNSWMNEDFEAWYHRKLVPSHETPRSKGVRDLLSRCGYTRMNVFIASAFWHLWAEDYWYPAGGYGTWFHTWVEELKRRKVDFQFKSRVTALLKSGNQVGGVRTHKGEVFRAKEFIYTGDYRFAVNQLIGRKAFSQKVLKAVDGAQHSDPLVSVYLGLNLSTEKLKEHLKSSHIFYFPTYDCKTEMDLGDPEAHRKVFLEVTAHCIEDPSLAEEGKSSVVLQAFSRAEWLEEWKTRGQWDHRSLEYRALKRRVGDQIIDVFEGVFPDVRKYIEYRDVGSPLSAYHFTRNWLGGSCGYELNWKAYPFLNPLAQTKTPLSNFHMAGHFTVWPGSVPTSALSGRVAAVRASQALVRRKSSPKKMRLGYEKTYGVLREHGKTFYMMAKLLGPERGRGIAAVYGFARTSDDIVDLPKKGDTPEKIHIRLEKMKEQLQRACRGEMVKPEFSVLAHTIQKYDIPLYPFDDLLAGLEMDLTQFRYPNFEELELYCYRVAGTIGLMITPIAGYEKDSEALEYARTLGTAFQLTNILRDVGEDIDRDRIYLPREDLEKFDVTEADLRSHRNDDDFKELMAFQIKRARALYRKGMALIPLVTTPQGRLAFQFAIDAYSGILKRIEENGYDVLTRRAYLTRFEKLAVIPSSLKNVWQASQSNQRAL